MILPDPPPPGVSDELFTMVYDELRELADRRLSRERPDHTLRPTELVHEVYLRLSKSPDLIITGRSHMMGLAGRVMRRILVEHARRRNTAKRGGAPLRVTLDEAAGGRPTQMFRRPGCLPRAPEFTVDSAPPPLLKS